MQTRFYKILYFILPGLVFLLISLQAGAANKPLLVNQLKNHASPYLALHGEDPVAWQDWSENAVTLARKQNKILYLSIGYFSCHWCHVMQQESYRNPKIAAFLNKHFIPVKIDRELEPALDARMIEFVERTRGMGGWPLNVFITPDGYPLYAVLYEPPENFQKILGKLNDLWVKDPEQLKKLAIENVQTAKGPGAPRIDKDKVKTYLDKLVIGVRGYADSLNGGFGEQSKFPSVPQLTFLVEYIKQTNDPGLKEILVLALDQMATQGLRDHLAGGFFRYTVDPGWTTPHFEKMLYDNAQLASIYLQASQLLKRPDYLVVAVDTLDFLLAGMRDKQGAFIASLSAVDDKGIEGGHYLWSKDQLKKILTAKEYRVYLLAWSIRDAPPFDQGYLPITGSSIKEIAKTTGLKSDEIEKLLQQAKVKLLEQRNKRILPRDTKLLAGWNGLALKALSETAKVTESTKFKNAAQEVRHYIINILWDGDSVKRSVVNGQEVGRVAIEDYAYVAAGLMAWADLTKLKSDYQLVAKVLDQAWSRFYSNQGWRLAEKSLIKTESGQDVIADSVMPSPSAVIASLTLQLAARNEDKKLRNKALSALNSGHELVNEDPFWYVSHVIASRDALATK